MFYSEHKPESAYILLAVVLSMFFVVLSNGILIKFEVVTQLKALCRNTCGK